MILSIQHKAVGHFRKAMDAITSSTNMSKWYNSDYDERIDMLALDHEITAFVCPSAGYLAFVEGLVISQDLTESRPKGVSGCVGEP